MLIIYQNASIVKRIYIDYHDTDSILQEMYDWCDIYAKVNLNSKDESLTKIIAIRPSFGIDIWNWFSLLKLMFFNYFSSYNKTFLLPKKQFFLDYLYTKIRRKKLEKYLSKDITSSSKYIFNISTLWYPSYIKNTNDYRKKFYTSAKENFDFEGGFYLIPNTNSEYLDYSRGFADLLIKKRISMNDYIIKTKKSYFVFNTPAVQDCHGWKLGEYFIRKSNSINPFREIIAK